jgi:acyl dehydratase
MDIRVRYLKPVEIGERIRVSGRITGVKARIIETEADVRDQTGEVVARASARFLKV